MARPPRGSYLLERIEALEAMIETGESGDPERPFLSPRWILEVQLRDALWFARHPAPAAPPWESR